MISCQRALTSPNLVRNLWPPMSKREPSKSMVWHRPPHRESFSTTIAARPPRARPKAQAMPAGPAPAMTIPEAASRGERSLGEG